MRNCKYDILLVMFIVLIFVSSVAAESADEQRRHAAIRMFVNGAYSGYCDAMIQSKTTSKISKIGPEYKT
ncbi:MAG: hypothetical protein ACLQF0_12470, partial [Dissulfurispiraceae bacterium]